MPSSLLNRALAVTRKIQKDQLYDWMIAITKAIGGIPFISGVGPFDTVARASSNRMLDAAASDLANLDNGVDVWTESFGGSTWIWNTAFPAATATDNVKTCRPTEWIATGNDGAFVRSLEGSQLARNQSAWVVDSTAADNEGTGSALDPLKSDDEIPRRWGPGPTPIAVPATVTYRQAPAAETNFDVQIMLGGSLTVFGTPTVTKPNTALTVVTPQVRTPGSEAAWAVTGVGLGAADVGKLLVITAGTAGNIGAYARILKDNGGGSVRVSPFGKFAISDSAPFTQVTPVVGDLVEVREPTVLKAGLLSFAPGYQAASAASPTRNCVVFDGVTLDGSSTLEGAVQTVGVSVFYARTILQNLTLVGLTHPNGYHRLVGGGGATIFVHSGFFQTYQSGMTGPVVAITGSIVQLGSDTYFQGARLLCSSCAQVFSFGAAWFDVSSSNMSIVVRGGGVWRQNGAVPDWGTANAGHGLTLESGGIYSYSTKPTVNGTVGAGREAQIGGTDKQYGAVPYVEGANNASLVLFA